MEPTTPRPDATQKRWRFGLYRRPHPDQVTTRPQNVRRRWPFGRYSLPD